MPLNQLNTTLGIKRAAHLLRRTCSGASVAEINEFASLTPQQAVDRLFNSEVPEVGYPIDPLTGTEWITTGNGLSESSDLEQYFFEWQIGKMLANGVAPSLRLPFVFRERLVFFMHTHFTTKRSSLRFPSGDMRALYYQQALFRMFAFDQEDLIVPPEDPNADPTDPASQPTSAPRNFKALTKKLCVDNAMLIFLDGGSNVKGNVNENFARELLELYTIGRGLEGYVPTPEFDGDYFVFTEQDVQEGARVLSGFNVDLNFTTIDVETGLPRGTVKGNVLNANRHDEGSKTFSDRLGGASVLPNPDLLNVGNATEASALDEVSQLVDLIYSQAETARAICREIYRFFVYHQIDDTLHNDIIQDMADVFTANEFKIQPVLEALFTSQHFYEAQAGQSDDNFGAIIKSPLDLVLGVFRDFDTVLPDYTTDAASYGPLFSTVLRAISNLGMDYYEPFEVAGYAAYHQYPIFNRSWISPNYLTARYALINDIVSASSNIEAGQVDIVQYVQNTFASEAPIARDLIIAIAGYFLPNAENLSFDTADTGDLSIGRLNYFLNAFLYSPQIDADPEAAWNNRWVNGIDPETVANQLANLFNAMLQTPEYQLM